MSVEIKVPILPESVADATVAAWHKQVGDAVSVDENLVDIETEKVVLEVPSTVDGVIKEIRAEEGATVGEQDIIAIIEEGASAAAAAAIGERSERRVPMTRLRSTIARRLKEAQDTQAMVI